MSFSHYAARKAALEELTRCGSLERVAVLIEAVASEPTESSLLVTRIALGATQAGILKAQRCSQLCPGGRAMPDDVAHWIDSLVSPSAAAVTGPNPVVDGGQNRMRADERLRPVSIRDSIGMESDDNFVIVQFGDFNCPRCKQAAPAFLLFGNRVDCRITVAFRHFPLSDVQTTSLTTLEACETAGGSREFCVCEPLDAAVVPPF